MTVKGKQLYKAWEQNLRKVMPPITVDEDPPQPSKAERGASQGAVLSPTTWLAFFDFRQVALSFPDVEKGDILLPGFPGKFIYTRDLAYKDELII